jgi:hypothetical protein
LINFLGLSLLPISQWGTNPHFLGSYSYMKAGYDGRAAVEMLAEPLIGEDGEQQLDSTHHLLYSLVFGTCKEIVFKFQIGCYSNMICYSGRA